MQAGGVGRIAWLQQWKEVQYLSRSCTARCSKEPGYIAGITSFSNRNGREKQCKIGLGDIHHSIRGKLSQLCRKGCLDEAVLILDAMDHQQGISGSADIYSSLLQGCAKTGSLAIGRRVHSHMMENRFEPDLHLANVIISMYMKCGSVMEACQMFNCMRERDVVSWTSMISGYVRLGHRKEAINFFKQMLQEGFEPDEFTFSNILQACGSPADLEQGRNVHEMIVGAGYESDVHVATALIRMYFQCGSLLDGRHVFDRMQSRNIFTWTAMVTGYAQEGDSEEAARLFFAMLQEGVKPDKVMYLGLLNAFQNHEQLDLGREVHAHVVDAGVVADVCVGNALISMYARCGSMEDALQVFNDMPKRDVVTWTTLIAHFSQTGQGGEALKFFKRMEHEGVKPDRVTYISVLNACVSPRKLEQGKQIHADIRKAGLESDIRVGNSLVSMYSRCGSVRDASQVFSKLVHRDVISWTTMFSALAHHGHPGDAFALFWQVVVPSYSMLICWLEEGKLMGVICGCIYLVCSGTEMGLKKRSSLFELGLDQVIHTLLEWCFSRFYSENFVLQ